MKSVSKIGVASAILVAVLVVLAVVFVLMAPKPESEVEGGGIPILEFGDSETVLEVGKRLAAGSLPRWFMATGDSEPDAARTGSSDPEVVAEACSLLSKVEVGDSVGDSVAGANRMFSVFYDDLGEVSFRFESDDLYDFIGVDVSGKFSTTGGDGLWNFARERRERAAAVLDEWENLGDVFFRAVSIDMGDSPMFDDYVSETRYAVARTGDLYFLERGNVSGYGEIRKVRLDDDVFGKFQDLAINDLRDYGNGGSESEGDAAWNMYLYDEEGNLQKALSFRSEKLEVPNALADMLTTAVESVKESEEAVATESIS